MGISRSRENAHKRLMRMYDAREKGTHTPLEWQVLKSLFGGICVKCGCRATNPQRDHILPVYQGGCDCIGNIQPLCARCNSGKGAERVDHRSARRPGWATAYQAAMLRLQGSI